MMGTCYFCGTTIDTPVYRSSLCPVCGKDLRICLNCSFYSPGSHWDCRETIGEAVKDKERANFCDFFRLGSRGRGDTKKTGPDDKLPDDNRKAFDKLFGE